MPGTFLHPPLHAPRPCCSSSWLFLPQQSFSPLASRHQCLSARQRPHLPGQSYSTRDKQLFHLLTKIHFQVSEQFLLLLVPGSPIVWLRQNRQPLARLCPAITFQSVAAVSSKTSRGPWSSIPGVPGQPSHFEANRTWAYWHSEATRQKAGCEPPSNAYHGWNEVCGLHARKLTVSDPVGVAHTEERKGPSSPLIPSPPPFPH